MAGDPDDHVAHFGNLSRAAEVPWVVRLTGEDLPRRRVCLPRTECPAGRAGGRPAVGAGVAPGRPVVACHAAERAAQALAATPETLGQAGFGVKQLESAQRRLLAAVRALTTLRELAPAAREPAPTLKIFRESREAA